MNKRGWIEVVCGPMFAGKSEELIRSISSKKNEPEWMLEFRLNSLKKFFELDNPTFGPELDIDFDNINYYKIYQIIN